MSETYLIHHGIKGQKWGVRRWQYEDGRYNEAGKERYFGSAKKLNGSGDNKYDAATFQKSIAAKYNVDKKYLNDDGTFNEEGMERYGVSSFTGDGPDLEDDYGYHTDFSDRLPPKKVDKKLTYKDIREEEEKYVKDGGMDDANYTTKFTKDLNNVIDTEFESSAYRLTSEALTEYRIAGLNLSDFAADEKRNPFKNVSRSKQQKYKSMRDDYEKAYNNLLAAVLKDAGYDHTDKDLLSLAKERLSRDSHGYYLWAPEHEYSYLDREYGLKLKHSEKMGSDRGYSETAKQGKLAVNAILPKLGATRLI